MAKVGIVMGSDSDMPVMSKAADMLEKFGIEYEMKNHLCTPRAGCIFRICKNRRGERLQGYHCRRRYGSSSAGYVRSYFPNAGHRNSDAYHIAWRS